MLEVHSPKSLRTWILNKCVITMSWLGFSVLAVIVSWELVLHVGNIKYMVVIGVCNHAAIGGVWGSIGSHSGTVY